VDNALNPPPSAHFLGLEEGGIERIFSRSTEIPPKIGACGGLWKNDLKISIHTSITILPAQKKNVFQTSVAFPVDNPPLVFFGFSNLIFSSFFQNTRGDPYFFFQVTQI